MIGGSSSSGVGREPSSLRTTELASTQPQWRMPLANDQRPLRRNDPPGSAVAVPLRIGGAGDARESAAEDRVEAEAVGEV